MLKIRQEWERRTNSALAKTGSPVRIDLRSYDAMFEAGEAPEGLVAQDHQGPRKTARSREGQSGLDGDNTISGFAREAARDRNNELWSTWHSLRAMEREKARLEGLSAVIAARREADRRIAAKGEKTRLKNARTAEEQCAAVAAARSIDMPDVSAGMKAALRWARGDEISPSASAEFDRPIDPETYDASDFDTRPSIGLEIGIRPRSKHRTGPRERSRS